ncbi:MAG: tRNA lysidine(34) synthetase TilS [Pseudomonadota bacterium]
MTIETGEELHQTLNDFFSKYKINNHKRIAVAISGGPDSMALAHMLMQNYEGEIYLLCVNHGLRASAESEIEKIQQWIQKIDNKNISFHVLDWEGDKPDSSIMEAARFARYDLLNKFCQSNEILALFVGHHQDDQAETFLS